MQQPAKHPWLLLFGKDMSQGIGGKYKGTASWCKVVALQAACRWQLDANTGCKEEQGTQAAHKAEADLLAGIELPTVGGSAEDWGGCTAAGERCN